jgi:hypothetical protein
MKYKKQIKFIKWYDLEFGNIFLKALMIFGSIIIVNNNNIENVIKSTLWFSCFMFYLLFEIISYDDRRKYE